MESDSRCVSIIERNRIKLVPSGQQFNRNGNYSHFFVFYWDLLNWIQSSSIARGSYNIEMEWNGMKWNEIEWNWRWKWISLPELKVNAAVVNGSVWKVEGYSFTAAFIALLSGELIPHGCKTTPFRIWYFRWPEKATLQVPRAIPHEGHRGWQPQSTHWSA